MPGGSKNGYDQRGAATTPAFKLWTGHHGIVNISSRILHVMGTIHLPSLTRSPKRSWSLGLHFPKIQSHVSVPRRAQNTSFLKLFDRFAQRFSHATCTGTYSIAPVEVLATVDKSIAGSVAAGIMIPCTPTQHQPFADQILNYVGLRYRLR